MMKKSIFYFLLLEIINTQSSHTCPTGCSVCSGSSGNCSACLSGYYLVGQNCNQCPTSDCSLCRLPCQVCVINSSDCQTCNDLANQEGVTCQCKPGYIMNTSNYFCDQCQFPCVTCQTTVNYCLTCAATYTIDSSTHTCSCLTNQYEVNGTPKTCQNCTSPCSTCTQSATNCGSCVTGLNRNLQTNQCVCDDGYYENTTCQPCQQPCINCISLSVCTSCKDPTYQSGSSCICQQTYFMNDSYMCQNCVAPCQNCSSELLCESCIQNYYISGNNCLQCTWPCYNCVDIPTKCTSCVDSNITPINNVCSSGGCPDGQFMDASLNCQPCIHPCLKCQTNGNHCLECANTFEMSTTTPNTCVCPVHKYLVVTNNPTECLSCTQPCDTCSGTADHCLTCIDSINQTVDSSYECKCNSGFITNGVNCEACQKPCLQCQGTTNYCTACKDIEHFISNGQCICNPGYINDNDYNCIPCQDEYQLVQGQCICEIGYYYIDFHCEQCSQNCSKCNSKYECTECIDQYYLQNTQCLKCQFPCLQCFDIQTCETCTDNYFIDDKGRCIQCMQNCEYCIDSTNCVKCFDEFYYHNQTCIPCSRQCQTCETNSKFCISCQNSNHILDKKKGTCYQINDFGDQYDYDVLEEILLLQDIRCNKNQQLIGYACIDQCGNGILNEQYEQCDDGNQLGGDGCSFFCIQEDSYLCKNYVNSPSICSFIQAPDFRLNLLSNQQNQTQLIELSFTQNVKIPTEMNFQEIAIISIIPQTLTNINILKITSLSTEFEYPKYQIIVEFIEPVEDAYLQIEFDQSLIKNEYDLDLIRYQMQIKLGNHFILSQQNQKQLTQIVLLNDAIMYSMISISGLSFLTGNANMFFNLLDLLQSLSYIRYMQYNFPLHLIQFLNIYSKISLKPILDHLQIDELLKYLNGGQLPFQNSKSLDQNQVNPLNQIYLLNAKGCYLLIIVSLLTYIICRLLTSQKILQMQIKLFQKYQQNEKYLRYILFFQKKIQSFCAKFKKEYISFGLPKVYFAILHQLFFSALLQFPNYSFNSLFMTFNSINAIFCLILILYISLSLLSITQTNIKDRLKWKYFYQDSQPQFWAFNQKSFQIYRIMFYIFMIVEALNYPEIQSILLSMSSFFYLKYLVKFRPLKSKYEEAKLISREFFFILISGSFLIYSFQLSYNQQLYYGWIHIALFTLMLISNLIIDLIECINKALQKHKRKQEKLQNKRNQQQNQSP